MYLEPQFDLKQRDPDKWSCSENKGTQEGRELETTAWQGRRGAADSGGEREAGPGAQKDWWLEEGTALLCVALWRGQPQVADTTPQGSTRYQLELLGGGLIYLGRW